MAGLFSRITRRAAPPGARGPERAPALTSPVSTWPEGSSEASSRPEPPRWGARNGGGWAADGDGAAPASTETPAPDFAPSWGSTPALAASAPPAGESTAAEAPTRAAPVVAPHPLRAAEPDADVPPAEPRADVAAVVPEPAAEPGDQPSFRHRARLRRRARYLRRLREVQLRDLGGLVLELDRAGRDRGDLVRQKLDALRATTTELTALDGVLGEPATLLELREPGVGGSCPRCRAVHGSVDRFCATCGQQLA